MKVCIAEKPSVAREIAHILGATARQDGYLEGNGYQVTWTFGHFCTLKTPDDYEPTWKRWDLYSLPMLPQTFDIKLKADKGVKKQFGVIKKLLKTAEVVINCGDAGQEGELIQRWVLKQARYKGPVQRLWISSLTAEAIRDGFQQLQDAKQFDNLYYAGFSRAIGDWLLGMNATRLYTLKYGGYKQLLSIGRVQTPTLAMLVKRHHEITNFVPAPFWELQTKYREVAFNCMKGKFSKKEEGEALLEKVKGKPFVILSAEKKKGKEYPPYLFDLTSLQVHCNKRFGYSAEMTLKIAQSLYEAKVITYPRVDTTYLPNDIYPKVPGILGKMSQYSQWTQPLLGKKLRKSAKVFNDKKVTDHHAIIPTGIERQLASNEQNVYDAIARRFIAAFYPDCIVSNSTVIGEADGVKFKATGKEILEPGWRVLFPKSPAKKVENREQGKESREKGLALSQAEGKGKGKEEKILPAFTVGEKGPHEPSLLEKQTQPPKTYTEGTLLRAMETAGKQVDDESLRDLMKANGIGRPSTRANIIETLFRRNYIRRQKKQIVPTETGVALIDTIQNDLLKSAELTGQWEKQLREIEAGTHSAQQFVRDMKQMVATLVEEVRQAAVHHRIAAPISPQSAKTSPKGKGKKASSKTKDIASLTCPKCKQGKVLTGKTAYGCSRWKEGCTLRVPFVYMEKKLSTGQAYRLLDKGATINLKGFKKGGKSVAGRVQFDNSGELIFTPKTPLRQAQRPQNPPAQNSKPQTQNSKKTMPCPKCGLGQVIKGKTAYGCSRWKAGCDFRFSFDAVREKAAGQPLSRELVEEILGERD